MTRAASLVFCASVLAGMTAGCGPETSEARPTEPARREAGRQHVIWDADRYYWECFWTAFPDGQGFGHREDFDALPIQGVMDPLLIEIDTICAEYFEDRQKLLAEALAGASDADADDAAAALLGRWSREIQPKLKRAKARYGIPGG